jgi:hypothetical protein
MPYEEDTIVRKLAQPAILLLVLALALTSNAAAQSAANDVSRTQLKFVGTTSLQRTPGMQGNMSPKLRRLFDHDSTNPPTAAANAQIATPAPNPISITGKGSNATGFDGLNSIDSALVNFGFIVEPPDQGLDVANGFVFEGINLAFAVYDASSGALLAGPTQLNAFFKLDFAQFTSDPRTYFDTQTRRWFATVLEADADPVTFNILGPTHALIAVSETDSPLSNFNVFSIDTTDDGSNGTQTHPGCPCFGDQPLLGADANGFYITTNEFGDPALVGMPAARNGAQVYALSKRELVAGLNPTVVHFGNIPLANGVLARSIHPAQSRFNREGDAESNNRGVEYFVSSFFPTFPLVNKVAVWAISGTSTLDESTPDVELTKVIIHSEAYGDPPNASQKAGPVPFGASQTPPQPEGLLSTGDSRMQQVFFADGLLWTAVSTVVQQGANQVSGIAYFVIKPSLEDDHVGARIHRQGYVSVANEHVFYPAIAVNENGEGAMVFTLSGPDFFPSAAFVRVHSDGSVGKVRILANGAFPDDGFTMYPPFSNGNGRWGDYSAATVDENGNPWFATEYVPATLSGFPQGLGVNFGTFIGTVKLEDENQH